MKRSLGWIAFLLLFPCFLRADVACTPTTPISRQSRTGMKHRDVAGVRSVSFQQITVEDMLNWPNPANIVKTSNSPIDNRENQAYTLAGDLWRVKVEANDCDFHLELTSPGGSRDADRVIAEIPQGPAFQQVRDGLIQALIAAGEGDLRHKDQIDLKQSIPIQVSGYAFFDAFHYSRTNPKRGHGHGTAMVGTIWELHPVWQARVVTPAAPPTAVATAETPAAEGPDPSDVYDFAIARSFLETLENGHTIQPTVKLTLGHHSAIHPLASDCEMHVIGSPQGAILGWPGPVVVEPPNLCQFDPDGNQSQDTQAWLAVFDDLSGQTCNVTGFPRIFTEHATGSSAASNPNHVFEIHPALAIDCGEQKLSFANFIRIFPGMRAISPSTATSCIKDRQLEVRWDERSQQYVFREHDGRCGNFAIVEVDGVNPRWIRSVGGGHSTIARMTADGQTTLTLKVYTLAPSDTDSWLAAAMSPGANTSDRRLVHGLFTYDYFAIQKALHPRGQDWQKPTNWTPIRFPIAFVAFGEAESAPWEEE